MNLEKTAEGQREFDAAVKNWVNPFADDEPIEAVCDLENPEFCEACD